MVKIKNILFSTCICFGTLGISTKLNANGHFLAGALSGYTHSLGIPATIYTLRNGYSYFTTSTWKDSQDDLITFAKGAALGLSLRMAQNFARYLDNLAKSKKKTRMLMRASKSEENQTPDQEEYEQVLSKDRAEVGASNK
jgi:hypothetical protein